MDQGTDDLLEVTARYCALRLDILAIADKIHGMPIEWANGVHAYDVADWLRDVLDGGGEFVDLTQSISREGSVELGHRMRAAGITDVEARGWISKTLGRNVKARHEITVKDERKMLRALDALDNGLREGGK